MVYTAPRTWSIGETPTAALLNTELRDNLLALRGLNLASARVYRTSDLSIASSAANTMIPWQAASWNIGTLWAVGNPTRLTAPIAGRYLLVLNEKWATSPTGRRGAGYQINGTSSAYELQAQPPTASKNPTLNACDIVDLAAGDYVEIYGYQTSGGAILLNSGVDTSFGILSLLATGTTAPGWTAPRTWSAGDILSPALLNTQLRDNLISLRNFNSQAARVYLSEDESIGASQRLSLKWALPMSWNVGTLWGGGETFVAPVHGYYFLTATLEWLGGATSEARAVGYRINDGSAAHDMQWQSSDANGPVTSGQDLVELQEGDQLTVYGYQDSGDSFSAHGGADDRSHATLMLMAAA